RAWARSRSERTTATRAGKPGRPHASRIAWRFEPRPEARTATARGWLTRSPALSLRREQRQLRSGLGLDAHAIVSREARVAEVGRIGGGGLAHAVEREIAQGVGAEIPADLFHGVTGPDQLLAGGRVDAVVTRPLDGRRRDPDVDGPRACAPHHPHDLAAGR